MTSKIFFSATTLGFYPEYLKNSYGENWPEDAIELSEEEIITYQKTSPPVGFTLTADSDGRPTHVIKMLSVDELFTNKQSEIVQKFKMAMSPITGIYTNEDIASFPTQEAEAKAYQADSNSPTPFIDGLLANRPTVDKATLVQRIIDNANDYKAVAGPAIGKKQHFEDQLYALKTQHEDPHQPDVTKADIDAIVVDYS